MQMFSGIRSLSERGLDALKNEPLGVRERLMGGKDVIGVKKAEACASH